MMYVRFVSPIIDPLSRVEAGFFRSVWAIHQRRQPDWLLRELDAQFDWFNAALSIPGRVRLTFRRGNDAVGVCWFRDDAHTHIERARYTAWQIEEAGLPVRMIRSRRPSPVFWRDAHQIVAQAGPETPRAFH